MSSRKARIWFSLNGDFGLTVDLFPDTAAGFLKGYVRRFAQMSHYHRGTPEVIGNSTLLVLEYTLKLSLEPWEGGDLDSQGGLG